MLIQKQFSRSPHFTGWLKVTDMLVNVADNDVIALEFRSDALRLKVHLSPSDITRLKKMLGFINQLEQPNPTTNDKP